MIMKRFQVKHIVNNNIACKKITQQEINNILTKISIIKLIFVNNYLPQQDFVGFFLRPKMTENAAALKQLLRVLCCFAVKAH